MKTDNDKEIIEKVLKDEYSKERFKSFDEKRVKLFMQKVLTLKSAEEKKRIDRLRKERLNCYECGNSCPDELIDEIFSEQRISDMERGKE